MIKIYLILVIILLSACTKNPNDVVAVKVGDEYYAVDQAAKTALADSDSSDQIVCRKKKVTGSNLKKKSCTTRAQMRLERERNKNELNKASEMHNQGIFEDKKSK